jgi:putative transposase
MSVTKRGQKSHNGKARRKGRVIGQAEDVNTEEFDKLALEERVALIQELIPLGLMAVAKELNREVEELVGSRYSRSSNESGPKRYGFNDGTVRLGGRIVPVKVPRVRDENGEIQLKSYQALHANPEVDSDSILRKVISGVSIRDVDMVLPESAGSIGTSRSSISRRVVNATSAKLQEFQARSLLDFPIVAVFIDGTVFGDDQMIIAMGIGVDGRKRVLGFVQAGSEHSTPITEMLRDCIRRGLRFPHGLLAIIDGSKGIRRAVIDVFGKFVLIQRCQWHKRENVVSYMSKSEQAAIRKHVQRAYNRPIYAEAVAVLKDLSSQLSRVNISAHKSLEEGLEETLTLHHIDMFRLFGPSMKTTNCIEALNSRVKDYCRNIKRWKNSSHKQRWLATAILETEPGLNRIQGHAELPQLCAALEKRLKITAPETESM